MGKLCEMIGRLEGLAGPLTQLIERLQDWPDLRVVIHDGLGPMQDLLMQVCHPVKMLSDSDEDRGQFPGQTGLCNPPRRDDLSTQDGQMLDAWGD